jgi:hypothetical protein
MLTVKIFSSIIIRLVYNDTKYPVSFITLKQISTVLLYSLYKQRKCLHILSLFLHVFTLKLHNIFLLLDDILGQIWYILFSPQIHAH